MQEPALSRRAWLASLVSGAGAVAAACSTPGTSETTTPEGRVLQWEGEDLIILVGGIQSSYPAGQPIRVNLLVNNQSQRLAQVRLRTKLLGRGDQAISEAEVATLTIRPEEAANTDRELQVARSLAAGDYTLLVEVPPWRLDGRETGRGVNLRARVQIDAPSP